MNAAERDAAIKTIIDKINTSDVAVFGIMDYWTFDGYLEIRNYLKSHPDALNKRVLPGIELRLEAPTDFRLNTHAIFSDSISTQRLHEFLATIKCGGLNQKPPSREQFIAIGRAYDDGKIRAHGYKPEDRADDAKMARLGMETALITRASLREAIQLVGKENCLVIQPYDTSDGLEKLDWKNHPFADKELMELADIFETKAPEVIDLFLGRPHPTKPTLTAEFIQNIGGRPKPVVRGSDAHQVADYGNYPNNRITWLKAEPTFEGLRQVCFEPAARCFIGELPSKLETVNRFPTKYIRSISIAKTQNSKTNEKWFDQIDLRINPGLVAVIGNKGGGKSALADIIALLGNTRVAKLEFLNEERFRKGKVLAESFSATLTWEDSTINTALLSESADGGKPERVRYLPQQAIEGLCNEIAQGSGTQFEQELKKVIFFHVSEEKKLGKQNLDELLSYRTDTVRATIRQMQSKVTALNQEIVALEKETSAGTQETYRNSLALKEEELKAHGAKMPREIPEVKPDASNPTATAALAEVTMAKTKLIELNTKKDQLVAERTELTSKQAILDRLSGRIQNIEREFNSFKLETKEEFISLGLSVDNIVKVEIDRTPIQDVERQTKARLVEIGECLTGSSGKIGLEKEIEEAIGRVKKLQDALDAPLKAYQAYLSAKSKWDARRAEILGSADKVDTLEYFKVKINILATALPEQLKTKRAARLQQVREIHREFVKLRDEYELHYKPVQEMAARNSMTNDSLLLHFNSFLSPAKLEERFFDFVNQGRKGSFYGVEEGRKALREIVARSDFNKEDDVVAFIESIMEALTVDGRAGDGRPINLSSQLKKESGEFYDFLFSLQYIEPRYTLRLGGKEIAQLSPGEKGALLLVFYLLLDREEIPIIIDQPEQNLDNESVVKLLVDCIKEARDRRQVIIVTHNPNLAIVCDADQIIYAQIEKSDGNKVTYQSGAIEERPINERGVNVLEGTYSAFDNRKKKWMPPIRL